MNQNIKDYLKVQNDLGQTPECETDAIQYTARMETLFKNNLLRESVTEARPPIIEADEKERIREEVEMHTSLEDFSSDALEQILRKNPMIGWECNRRRFNSKFWVPNGVNFPPMLWINSISSGITSFGVTKLKRNLRSMIRLNLVIKSLTF